jgi:flagellar biogenesis protein FliO
MKEATMHLVQHNKTEGLASWLLSMWSRRTMFAGSARAKPRKHMRVVETLPIGPKRNLFLISCDGERFLVGSGPDSVQTIVRVRAESAGLALVRGGE